MLNGPLNTNPAHDKVPVSTNDVHVICPPLIVLVPALIVFVEVKPFTDAVPDEIMEVHDTAPRITGDVEPS